MVHTCSLVVGFHVRTCVRAHTHTHVRAYTPGFFLRVANSRLVCASKICPTPRVFRTKSGDETGGGDRERVFGTVKRKVGVERSRCYLG